MLLLMDNFSREESPRTQAYKKYMYLKVSSPEIAVM